MSIGKRLAELRGNRSQQQFADMLGIHKNTYANYERGVSYPDSRLLELICTKFGISTAWLLMGTGPMYLNGKEEEGKADKPEEKIEENRKVSYIDEATEVVYEAIRETGAKLNPRQIRAMIEVVKEEMKDKTVDMLHVLKGKGPENEERSNREG